MDSSRSELDMFMDKLVTHYFTLLERWKDPLQWGDTCCLNEGQVTVKVFQCLEFLLLFIGIIYY